MQGQEEQNVVLGNITVNFIQNSSGIFVGTNYAHGWSTNSKINNGFGSSKGSDHRCSINFVYDNDIIDTPIEDVKTIILNQQPREGIPVNQNIDFHSIDVNAVNINSSISIGENNQAGWSSHRKSNFGTQMIGESIIENSTNTIIDNDIIDTAIHHVHTCPS